MALFAPMGQEANDRWEAHKRSMLPVPRCAGCEGRDEEHEPLCEVAVRTHAAELAGRLGQGAAASALAEAIREALAWSDPWCFPARHWRDVAEEAAGLAGSVDGMDRQGHGR